MCKNKKRLRAITFLTVVFLFSLAGQSQIEVLRADSDTGELASVSQSGPDMSKSARAPRDIQEVAPASLFKQAHFEPLLLLLLGTTLLGIATGIRFLLSRNPKSKSNVL